jgi:hypothetical protein
MSPEEIGLLKWDDGGEPIMPGDLDAEMQAWMAKHGHKPVTFSVTHKWMMTAGKVLADTIRPLRRRIEALEAEVRAGHERIKALEAREAADEAE